MGGRVCHHHIRRYVVAGGHASRARVTMETVYIYIKHKAVYYVSEVCSTVPPEGCVFRSSAVNISLLDHLVILVP